MWTVIFSKDGKIEQQESFKRYFHAQMLADNLILGNDSHFGAANLPSFKDGEKYEKNGITISVTGIDDVVPIKKPKTKKIKIEKSAFISWIETRIQKGRWCVDEG